MNNKTILFPEVLKIFVALAVIVILVYLASQLYGVFIVKPDLEQARATLDKIVGKARLLDEDESTEVLITGPKDWYLISYNEERLGKLEEAGITAEMPKECGGKSCLCVCKEGEGEGYYNNPYFNGCKEIGVCDNVAGMEVEGDESCEFEMSGYIRKSSNCILMKKVPIAVKLKRDKDRLLLINENEK